MRGRALLVIFFLLSAALFPVLAGGQSPPAPTAEDASKNDKPKDDKTQASDLKAATKSANDAAANANKATEDVKAQAVSQAKAVKAAENKAEEAASTAKSAATQATEAKSSADSAAKAAADANKTATDASSKASQAVEASETAASLLAKQRSEYLELLGGSKSATQVVTCKWGQRPDKPSKKDGNDKPAKDATIRIDEPPLSCSPALLVSGDQVSTIRVEGLPNVTKKVSVVAMDPWDSGELASDEIIVPASLDTARIKVHMNRFLLPTYGGHFSSYKTAVRRLRPANRKSLADLAIVLSGSALQLEVIVEPEGDNARAAPVYIVYQRWSVETGGFVALTNLSDQTLVTSSSTAGGKATVHVDKVRAGSSPTQDTGIFLNLVPRNYPFLGLGLGLSSTAGRAQSIYLGLSLRARTFGDHGLASLSFAAANRQVKVFRGVTGGDFEADSAKLQGSLESRLGYAVMINLGFHFGSIGGEEDAAKGQ
jgi:hypothetical protein